MMADIAADAFHRVQRFSTDWHANSFAGSTVRKVTRGMWALDLLNDTLLVALLPSLVDAGRLDRAARLALAGDGRWSSPSARCVYIARDRRRCRSAMSRRRRGSPTPGTRGSAARWPTR